VTFLETIKAIPITDLAEKVGFKVTRKGQYYSLREHDSVRIDPVKNCFWRNSTFSSGHKGGSGSSIDFMMEFCGATDYKAAMRQLAQLYGIDGNNLDKHTAFIQKAPQTPSRGINERFSEGLVLPQAADDNECVKRYLKGRGIADDVIDYFLEKKMLYQDIRKNCVFVSPAKDFGCMRGTNLEKRFVRDCNGNNYESCFFFKHSDEVKKIVVTESVIDLMSIMTCFSIKGISLEGYAFLAIAGTSKIHSLFNHLKANTEVEQIYLCLDNDKPGIGADDRAMEGLKEIHYEGKVSIVKPPDNTCKDWNDYITRRRKSA